MVLKKRFGFKTSLYRGVFFRVSCNTFSNKISLLSINQKTKDDRSSFDLYKTKTFQKRYTKPDISSIGTADLKNHESLQTDLFFHRLNNKFGHKINSYIPAWSNYDVNKYNGLLRINRDVICLTFQSTSHCLYSTFNMYRLCYRYTGFLSVHCEMKACFCLKALTAAAYRIHVDY